MDKVIVHCKKVSLLAFQLALNHSRDIVLANICKESAYYHDYGKEGMIHLINKEGPLSDEEWRIVKKHSEYSLEHNDVKNLTAEVRKGIVEHHENYDGTGYPSGLKGDDISYQGRIIRIADSYDALISKRSYKIGYNSIEALNIMYQDKHLYDEEVLKVLFDLKGYPTKEYFCEWDSLIQKKREIG